ncbi:MAG: methionine--tRNA ligase [Candidatus Micrarchaeota archaeon]|nr:methionine--tRNA ligase [Candidatus Micrarchaeota archaeon]MDE1834717.1 methionine--tRNA ligase [Candidatus Micrarchaeota archaeon]MDE1859020.1 methionine--tRNA ligase [Candidatus Micrarchaeota archaeon]
MPKFYITTPIYYVNDKPHIGHAYTTIAADVIARWHRLRGDDVFFLTGTDEHGEKIMKAATAAGKSPQEFVDGLAVVYKDAWKKLNISYDYFVRTSDPNHERLVKLFVDKLYKSGDLYKGIYEGWYCVSDETFFTQLQLRDGKCPECGKEVKLIKEEDYFFKLSKYQQRLLDFYKENPDFLSPKFRADEIKNRVKAGLKDLSITRSAVKWGVEFPPDKSYTIYVWVDALLNYVTALDWPDGKRFGEFWPADVHVMAKEINWFHSVIWPALLFCAGMEPPKKIFAHGWWTVDGKKMSKSVGNVVDPIDMSRKYSTDAFRYFLLREMPFGDDGDFSEKALVTRLNTELASDLGNLFNRVFTLAEKFDGKIEGRVELEMQLDIEGITKSMDNIELFNALAKIFEYVAAANKYVNDTRPWALKDEQLGNALYNLLEACRVLSIVLYPFMPETSEKVAKQLGTKVGTLEECKFRKFSAKVSKGELLFKKVDAG